MAKYIATDVLYSGLKNLCEKYNISFGGESSGFGKDLSELPKNIATDVAPVIHGKWMGTVCTACGTSVSFYFDCNYCPVCGAKMDGDDNG